MVVDSSADHLNGFKDELKKWKENGFLEHSYVKVEQGKLNASFHYREHTRNQKFIDRMNSKKN